MSLRSLLNLHVRPASTLDLRLKPIDCRVYNRLYERPLQTAGALIRDLQLAKETVRLSLARLVDTGWVYTHLAPGRVRGKVFIPWMPDEVEQRVASLLAQRRTTVRYYSEWLMRCLLDLLVPDMAYIDNAYPNWLITPQGGLRLQLDRWYEDLNVAFEFQGPQHFQKGDRFVRTDEDLSRRLRYDGEKIRLCSLQQVELIEVTGPELDFESFRDKIRGKVPLLPLRESGPLYRELLGMSRQYVSYLRSSGG